MSDSLVVRGAREHNLRNVSLDLPRDKLIVFTGLSGSGKSSLAFDTIYAEGQRRYVESLSAYARQFLGQMDKPDVDFIEGLSPAISIDQKSRVAQPAVDGRARSPRSTTTSGCCTPASACRTARTTARPVTRQTPQQIVDRILELPEGTRFQVLAPVVRGRKGTYETLLADLAAQGFARARVDGEIHELTDTVDLARYEQHTIEVVVDRLVRRDGIERRLTDSLETALKLADGVAEVRSSPQGRRGATSETLTFSQHLACPTCGRSLRGARAAQLLVQLAVRRLRAAATGSAPASRSTPSWSCPTPTSRLAEGAIAPWAGGQQPVLQPAGRGGGRGARHRRRRRRGRSSPAKQQKVLLYGTGKDAGARQVQEPLRPRARRTTRSTRASSRSCSAATREAESDSAREQIEGYMREVPCPDCGGARLKPLSLAVTIDGNNIAEICDAVDRRGGQGARRARAVRARPHDRRARASRRSTPAWASCSTSASTTSRLSRSRGHARRRRGAAHPAGVADRQRARRRALRARRAVDRAAPARQPPPDRDAHPPARPRQHRARRRARRGDDPGRRPRRRHRAGRGGARRRRSSTPGR